MRGCRVTVAVMSVMAEEVAENLGGRTATGTYESANDGKTPVPDQPEYDLIADATETLSWVRRSPEYDLPRLEWVNLLDALLNRIDDIKEDLDSARAVIAAVEAVLNDPKYWDWHPADRHLRIRAALSSPPSPTGAIETVARQIIAHAADEPEWGDYPEIGEHDWRRICDRVAEIAAFPPADDFDTAYALLASRAGEGVL